MTTPATLVAKSWGKRVRQRRSDLTPAGTARTSSQDDHMSQTTLAALIDMDQAAVSRFERGEATWTPQHMLAFSVALDMPLDRLFPWPLGIEGMEIMRREAAAKREPAA
jgi:transcriptional regulator with XRE-family HTH domain